MNASPQTTPEYKRPVPGIISLWCTVTVAVLVANFALRYWRSLPDPEFEQIIAFVEETGESTTVPAACLKYFKLTSDDTTFKQVVLTAEGNRLRSIQVQKVDDNFVVFLVNVEASTMAGNFYLTGNHARLLKSANMGEQPMPIDDAATRFQEELAFWRKRL